MKYLLRSTQGLSDGSIGCSSSPIGFADTEKECWTYALAEFKTSQFARYPWWHDGQRPLGYEVHEIENKQLKIAHWLKPLSEKFRK